MAQQNLAIDEAGNVWDMSSGQPRFVRGSQQSVQTKPADPKLPYEVRAAQGDAAAAPYRGPAAAANLTNTQTSTQRAQDGIVYDRAAAIDKARDGYRQDKRILKFEEALPVAISGLKSPGNVAGDNLLVNAIAKTLDPITGVQGRESANWENSQPALDKMKAQLLRQFGDDGYGNFTPEARQKIRETVRVRLKTLGQQYDQARGEHANYIQSLGLPNADTDTILGPHAYAPFKAAEEEYIKASGGTPKVNGVPTELTSDQKAEFFKILQRDGADAADTYLRQFGIAMKDKSAADRPYSKELTPPEPGTYANSYLAQGLSGMNEGLAGLLDAPGNILSSVANLVPKGINAIANTKIPTLPEGGWFRNALTGLGSILPQTEDPSKRFVRRTGESVGAAVVPAGFAGSLGRAGSVLLSGLGGGIGGATAQQVAPGNPLAEMAGELAVGGMFAAGTLKAGQRAAQRKIEAAVPTVADLRREASGLYRKAETRGVAATPAQTKQLAADMRQTLRAEGQIGPKGKITDADSNTSKAFNLIEQYSGRPMKPREMNTIRTVLADSRKSADPSDQRIGNILLDQFDDWVSPLAPEFDQARSVASRYLQAQDLERARELAGARASQFTGSGFENALRTEYRALDRNTIKGNQHFGSDVNTAIQKVARGTPTSNFFRGLGRLAPTGPVSGMGSVVPGLAAGALTDPFTGGVVGGSLAGAGMFGRTAATRMGIRAADEAELIARNGGALPQSPLLSPEFEKLAAWLAATEQAKYLQDR